MFLRRKVEVNGVDDIWGADLVDMQEWSKIYKGNKVLFHYFLYEYLKRLMINKVQTIIVHEQMRKM